ncbi:MBL fold metallo-hydrolase, partial [Rhizobium leguminosarum]
AFPSAPAVRRCGRETQAQAAFPESFAARDNQVVVI